MKLKTFTLFLAHLAAGTVLAQPAARTPVEVLHSGRDSVGVRLAFEVRESIRGSNGMRLVTASEVDARLVLHIVTIEGTSTPGISTAASVSLTYDTKSIPLNGFFITSFVQTCGNNRTRECGRDLTADIDGEMEKLRRDWPSLARELR